MRNSNRHPCNGTVKRCAVCERQIRLCPALLLPNRALLKEVRGPLQGASRGRPKLVTSPARRQLKLGRARTNGQFREARTLGSRRRSILITDL
jgi:hypothetical protein